MKEQQIVLNTESVLDYLNCDSQIRVALKAAREAGYQSVELWHVATPEQNAPWRPFLDEAGLRCCALHELFEEVARPRKKPSKKRTVWTAACWLSGVPGIPFGPSWRA